MKKFKKLILTGGIFSSSLFFNSAYSQETKEYYTGNPNDPKSEIKKIDRETWTELNNQNNYSYWMKDAADKNGVTKWYIVPKTNPKLTPPPSKTGNYNTNAPDKKPVTNSYNPNKTYYIPPATKTNSDLGNALLIGGAAVGTALLLNELFKPRNKAPVYYSAPPANNPPTNYNSNPEENKKAFDEWLNGKGETENTNKNWWSDENGEEKTENKNWWSEEQKQEKPKEAEEFFKKPESEQKIKFGMNEKEKEEFIKKYEIKYNSLDKLQAGKISRELSDFVEKQAGYSPETKIWFDKKYQEAEEFYKEFYKNDPEAYAKTKDLDKLHKVIGYESYKLAKEYTPVGQVLESMEIYEDIKEKGMENFWKEEVKEADEFYKKRESYPKLKVMPDEKGLEKILGTDVYVPKIEKDKYSEQINKIAYESDVAKVIRYRAYQYAKNNSEAGKVIEGIEKVEQMKKNDSKFFWDE